MLVSCVGSGIGSLSFSIPNRCNPIASLAFATASSVVSPQGKHPGKSGNSIDIPSSAYENIAG